MKKILNLILLTIFLASFVVASPVPNMLTVFSGTILDAATNQHVGSGYKVDVYCYTDPSIVNLVDTVYTTPTGSFSTSINNEASAFQCQFGDYAYIIVEDQFQSGNEMVQQDVDFDYVRINQGISVPEFGVFGLAVAGIASFSFIAKRRKQ